MTPAAFEHRVHDFLAQKRIAVLKLTGGPPQ
jgi:hypothetical protein